MMLDKLFQVSTAQAITAASAASTGQVDFGPTLRDASDQRRLVMHYHVVEAFVVDAGTPALIFANVLSIATDLVSFPTYVGATIQYLAADLTLNSHIYVPVTPLSTAQAALLKTSAASGFPHRYFGAFYQLGGGTFSAGKITADLCIDPRSELRIEHYADALN